MEKVELNKVFVELIELNIVLLTVKNNATIEVEDVTEIKAFNLNLIGNNDYGVIVDAQNYTSISPEARGLMTSEYIEKNRVAIAIIIYELPQRIVGNFYINFNKPAVPTKLFSKRQEALSWVRKHLNQ